MDNDAVNHPGYYNNGGIEAIDVIEAWNLGFHLGNTVKYISRAGKKNADKELEDLKKARWYLDRYIDDSCPQSITPVCKYHRKQSFDIFDFLPRLGSVIFLIWGAICILAEEYLFGSCLMLVGVVSRLILTNYHLIEEIRELKARYDSKSPAEGTEIATDTEVKSESGEDKSE